MLVYSPLLEWITNMNCFTGPRVARIGMKPQLFCIKVRLGLPIHILLLMRMSFVVKVLLNSRRTLSRFQRMELTSWRSTLEFIPDRAEEVILEHP
jgi:hypothetical protein